MQGYNVPTKCLLRLQGCGYATVTPGAFPQHQGGTRDREAPLDMSAVQGDPKRPREVHSFVREPVEQPRGLADYYSTISFLCGIGGFSMKWRVLAWLSFLFCGAAFANTRNGESDVRQLSWSIMMATSAIVSSYAGAYQAASVAAGDAAAAPEPVD